MSSFDWISIEDEIPNIDLYDVILGKNLHFV